MVRLFSVLENLRWGNTSERRQLDKKQTKTASQTGKQPSSIRESSKFPGASVSGCFDVSDDPLMSYGTTCVCVCVGSTPLTIKHSITAVREPSPKHPNQIRAQQNDRPNRPFIIPHPTNGVVSLPFVPVHASSRVVKGFCRGMLYESVAVVFAAAVGVISQPDIARTFGVHFCLFSLALPHYFRFDTEARGRRSHTLSKIEIEAC